MWYRYFRQLLCTLAKNSIFRTKATVDQVRALPTNRKLKLKHFARYQQMYHRNKRNLVDMILSDKEEATTFPTETSIQNIYQSIYESASPADTIPSTDYYRVFLEEIKSYKKDMSKSGIDNFSSVHLLKVNNNCYRALLTSN